MLRISEQTSQKLIDGLRDHDMGKYTSAIFDGVEEVIEEVQNDLAAAGIHEAIVYIAAFKLMAGYIQEKEDISDELITTICGMADYAHESKGDKNK